MSTGRTFPSCPVCRSDTFVLGSGQDRTKIETLTCRTGQIDPFSIEKGNKLLIYTCPIYSSLTDVTVGFLNHGLVN